MKTSLITFHLLLGLLLSASASAETSKLETLALQAPNASNWASAPLDRVVPSEIRTNLVFLRENLLDEGAKSPKANKEAYTLGSQLCDGLISAFDERSRTLAEAGYRRTQAMADSRVSGGILDTRRNYMMSWPQYARDQDFRTELMRQQDNKIELKSEKPKLQWVRRAAFIRKRFDVAYSKYRNELRKSGVVVKDLPVDAAENIKKSQSRPISGSATFSVQGFEKGGRLRVWGEGGKRQDATELLGSTILNDIVKVSGNSFNFIALNSKGVIHGMDKSAWAYGKLAVDIDLPVYIDQNAQVIPQSPNLRMLANRISKPVISAKCGDRRLAALTEDGAVHLLVDDRIELDSHRRLAQKLAAMDDVVAIELANFVGIGLRRDGTVFTWGDDRTSGPKAEIIEAPPSVRNIVAVQAGFTCLALDRDGKVHAWTEFGHNDKGGTDLPRNLGKVVRIRASNSSGYYAAQMESGHWKAWGNTRGGVVDFINNDMGPAIDLDFSYWGGDRGIVWWIEPKD